MINFKKLEEVAFALIPKHRGGMRSFHVAAIYKKSKLVSIGFNKDVTHPRTKDFRYYELAKVHAELNCVIRGGREDYEGYSMAVLRINRHDKMDYSCPCNGCRDLLRQLGFSKVYHTMRDGSWHDFNIWEKPLEKNPQRFVCSLIRRGK